MSRKVDGLKKLVLNATGHTITGSTTLALLKSFIYEQTGKTISGRTFGQVLANFDDASVSAVTVSVTSAAGAVTGATIVIKDGAGKSVAPSSGAYNLKIGTYTYTVSATGYQTATGSITIAYSDIATGTKTVTVTLTAEEAAEE